MATLFFILWMITLAGFLCAMWAVSQSREQTLDEKNRHEVCHEAVEAVLRTACARTDASILRVMADKWDSIEEQTNLKQLARERYEAGGPSMPAIWLRQQADLIDPARIETIGVELMDGTIV